MNDRLARLEAQLDALAREVAAIDERLVALEARGAAATAVPAGMAIDAAGPEAARPPSRESDATAVISLVGRTLVVLAGAYLLRALTESGTLAPTAGVAAGLAYALVWIAMAERAGAAGRRSSAAFHGVAFVFIAFPLVFERTAPDGPLHVLGNGAGAAALGGLAAVSLGAAARRGLPVVAWLTTIGALVTAAGLMLLSGVVGPYAVYLVLVGVATLWIGYVLDWIALRWPVALVADFAVFVIALRAVGARAPDTPATALVVQVLLVAAYLGSFAARTLFLNRDVIPFEVMQSIAVIGVGLGGAAYVTHATGVGMAPLGVAALLIGAGAYGVAIAFVERRQRRRKNFYFYTTAALVFTMAGCALLLPPAGTALTWAALAVAAAAAGRRACRVTFDAHSAVYVAGAAAAGGLLLHAAHGLGLPGATPPHDPGLVAVVVLAAAAACTLALGRAPERPAWERLPRLALLLVTVGGVMGVATDWLVPPLAQVSESAFDAGIVATLRTAMLVGGALTLAWAGGARRFVEAGWLVYPLLTVIGVKFLFEDMRASRPATLFVAFALYGAALIVGPRLRRGRATPRQGPEG